MTANESLITESRKAKRELIDKAVSGLSLNEAEEKFLAFLVDMEDVETVLKFCNIIRKAKEYRQ
ncbi:hypothetical protein MKC69_12585 [[Clostridium] innocuum]|uniref:hypothetical protein n=1 Tax=Clostridium innocuum TaxID=1522 RepID=UPI001F598881|nr:hypothetical protein [[Clostridium] innocuum]MCI3002023.1 hypothetical protein [[Clostridium] innocuum]MCR0177583.1 hypothetical protein [[Clostridium] innocuum]MCR0211070.1 hypothetical protein [[Clostridium] innocuum]MCR0255477.1 hypothetical protein [[Clostridium] innocuum]MCR0424229.1 hypothetical protein [[Clostridium] innocuum]